MSYIQHGEVDMLHYISSSSSSSNVSSERRSKRPRCSAYNTSYRVKNYLNLK